MPQARSISQATSLPLRQNTRLEVQGTPSRWRHGVELSQLFAAIPPEEASDILSAARSTNFDRRQTIFYAGEKVQRVVFLTEGSVKITQIDEFGSTVILRLLGPGEVVGELGGGRLLTHLTAAEARVPCKALIWDLNVFEALSERFPTLQRNTLTDPLWDSTSAGPAPPLRAISFSPSGIESPSQTPSARANWSAP